jgi:hypothetical protein
MLPRNQNEASVALLILDRTDFTASNMINNKRAPTKS